MPVVLEQLRAREAERGTALVEREQAAQQELARLQEELGRLRDQIAHQRDELEDAEARSIGSFLESEAKCVAAALNAVEATRARVPVERQRVVRLLGEAAVTDYERMRTILAGRSEDELTRQAFEALERMTRMKLPSYAALLDQQTQLAQITLRHVLFIGDGAQPVLVAPISGEALEAEQAMRAACAFWAATLHVASEWPEEQREAPTYGAVAGCLAAQLPGYIEPETLAVALEEAWQSRPSLRGLSVAVDVVDVALLDLTTKDALEADVEVTRPPNAERWLPIVAGRLRCLPRELLALVQQLGLAAPDDQIDAETESLLKVVIDPPAPVVAPAPTARGSRSPAAAIATARKPSVAARMLEKLLSDRRVGGRHTRIEHAYGHGFADGEKQLAQQALEWLTRDGILMSKLNEGSQHTSINPRRLADVGAIIRGEWPRASESPEIFRAAEA